MSREPWVKPPKPKPKPKPSDFSEEYTGRMVKVVLGDGSTVEGVVAEARKFWFKVKVAGGKTYYVNKGYVKWIEGLG